MNEDRVREEEGSSDLERDPLAIIRQRWNLDGSVQLGAVPTPMRPLYAALIRDMRWLVNEVVQSRIGLSQIPAVPDLEEPPVRKSKAPAAPTITPEMLAAILAGLAQQAQPVKSKPKPRPKPKSRPAIASPAASPGKLLSGGAVPDDGEHDEGAEEEVIE